MSDILSPDHYKITFHFRDGIFRISKTDTVQKYTYISMNIFVNTSVLLMHSMDLSYKYGLNLAPLWMSNIPNKKKHPENTDLCHP